MNEEIYLSEEDLLNGSISEKDKIIFNLQQKAEQLEKENQKFFEELNTCMIERNSFLDKVEQLENIRKEIEKEYNYLSQSVITDRTEFDDEEQMIRAYQDIAVKKFCIYLLNILNKGSKENASTN